MNKAMTIGLSVSMATVLSFGLVGCGNSNNATDTPSPATATTEVAVERSAPGVTESNDIKMALQKATVFTENNVIMTSSGKKFTITSSGELATTQDKLSPAVGEKFYAINYTYTTSESAYMDDENKVTLTINGDTSTLGKSLYEEGTLLVSAPVDAEIILGFQDNGITQNINFQDAKRVVGVADGLYENSVGKLSDPSTTEVRQVADVKVTLKLSYAEATRQAYVGEDSALKWADDGKGTWVLLSLDDPAWDTGGHSAQLKDPTNKILLKDAKGNEYTGIKTDAGSSAGDATFAFKVPLNTDEFTIHTENSISLTSWGDNIGATGNIVTEKVKISFK